MAEALRLVHETDGQSVVISEERPDRRNSSQRVHTPGAKLRFARAKGVWTLYWMRADLRRHVYGSASPTADLTALVEVVDRDESCAFVGLRRPGHYGAGAGPAVRSASSSRSAGMACE